MLLLLLGVSSWRKARIIEIVYRRRFERHGVDESIAAAVSAITSGRYVMDGCESSVRVRRRVIR